MTGFFTAAATTVDDVPGILAGPLRDRVRAAGDDPDHGATCARTGAEWARIADERYRALTELHPTREPLLRIGVKDNVHARGFSTRLGSRHLRRYPREDAAILTGVPAESVTAKTALTEATLGLGAGCHNPLFPRHSPGGSSTGSAVAVAANICDLAVGTDSLGSMRKPALSCGVVSLRRTHHPDLLRGVMPGAPSVDGVGWFARTVADLAFAAERFPTVTGHLHPTPPVRRPMRLAMVTDVLDDPFCDDAVRRSYEDVAKRAADAGVEVEWIALGAVWAERLEGWALCAREYHDSLAPWVDEVGPLGPDVEAVLRLGRRVAPERARAARASRPRWRETTTALLGTADAFALPVFHRQVASPEATAAMPMIFPDLDAPGAEAGAGYTPVASMLGWPALALPITDGAIVDGTAPASVQLTGRVGTEPALIELGLALESNL